MDSLRAAAILARTPSLAAEHVRALIAATGSLESAVSIGDCAIAGVALPDAARAFLAAVDDAAIDADLAWAERTGARIIPCTATEYPPLLASTAGPPPALYVLGNVASLASPQLAMVGSRDCSPSGRSTARAFAEHFAHNGLTVTSGLALGIDAASHEGALSKNGLTIAVCGCGLDIVYPRRNASLAERIRAHGAIVSEFPPRTQPLRPHFPQRNRVISGLSLGTLVVEAALTSGSLITAQYALNQGRDVFAIPGSIHNRLSHGCHKLIREGAMLVETAAEVVTELANFLSVQSLAPGREAAPDGAGGPPALDKEYEILLDALGFEPASIDLLVARTGIPGDSVASMLLILELQGRVAPHAGGRYGRLL
jgi:DNA processing protein